MRPQGALLPVLAFLGSCAGAPNRESEDQRSQVPSIERFYADLETLIARHYPAATFQRLQDGVHFEYDTRVFLVHEPLKTGEWQDAFEMRGPNRGGVLGNITLEKGPYQGAAEVPQSFDKRYFTMLLMAPDLPALDAHVRVELWYPANVDAGFVKDFTKLVESLGS